MNIIKNGSQGILLPELNIAFDHSGGNAKYTFISHAHTDHMPHSRYAEVYCTPNTQKLMTKRGYQGTSTVLRFGQPLETDRARVTFYPAGHILGSAMIFVESEAGSVLYTGDYRRPPSPVTEGFELPVQPVNHFITEATFSLPIYKWKAPDQLAEEVRKFALETLNDDSTPVFLGYDLGKTQELMHMLAPTGLPLKIRSKAADLCPIYEQAGFNLGNYEPYQPNYNKDKVLITTRTALNNGFAPELEKKVAYCSGWAVRMKNRTQMKADQFIPLSDHLDFFELISICKKLNPQKVHITHTPNPTVVQHYLNQLAIKSRFLGE